MFDYFWCQVSPRKIGDIRCLHKRPTRTDVIRRGSVCSPLDDARILTEKQHVKAVVDLYKTDNFLELKVPMVEQKALGSAPDLLIARASAEGDTIGCFRHPL